MAAIDPKHKAGDNSYQEFPRGLSWLLTFFTLAILVGTVAALITRWHSLNHWLIYLYAGLFTIYLIAENRAHTQPSETGKRTHEVLRYLLTFFWWLLIAAALFEYTLWNRSNSLVTLAGTLISLAGIVLRVWSVSTLGRFYSGHIETWHNHSVVHDGPYKLIRHPGYTGSMLQVIGMPLVVNAYLTLIVSAILIVLFLRRMIWEESFLVQSLPGYQDYVSHTWRIIPGIW